MSFGIPWKVCRGEYFDARIEEFPEEFVKNELIAFLRAAATASIDELKSYISRFLSRVARNFFPYDISKTDQIKEFMKKFEYCKSINMKKNYYSVLYHSSIKRFEDFIEQRISNFEILCEFDCVMAFSTSINNDEFRKNLEKFHMNDDEIDFMIIYPTILSKRQSELARNIQNLIDTCGMNVSPNFITNNKQLVTFIKKIFDRMTNAMEQKVVGCFDTVFKSNISLFSSLGKFLSCMVKTIEHEKMNEYSNVVETYNKFISVAKFYEHNVSQFKK